MDTVCGDETGPKIWKFKDIFESAAQKWPKFRVGQKFKILGLLFGQKTAPNGWKSGDRKNGVPKNGQNSLWGKTGHL